MKNQENQSVKIATGYNKNNSNVFYRINFFNKISDTIASQKFKHVKAFSGRNQILYVFFVHNLMIILVMIMIQIEVMKLLGVVLFAYHSITQKNQREIWRCILDINSK